MKHKNCRTKYPILLLHGLNCRDDKPVFYFGRIPDALTKQGAKVYLGSQDAWGTIESNALQIKNRMAAIVATEKCEKVNIIAHSKGGLETRYLASALMQQDRIASISTISTPHQDIVDCRKKNLKHFSATNFYVKIVQELVERGL